MATSKPQSLSQSRNTIVHHRPAAAGDTAQLFANAHRLTDDLYLSSLGARQTLNGLGYCWDIAGWELDYWVSSCPECPHPLADLGAGYGFQVGAAMACGRDVIALDCDERHLRLLRERLAAAQVETALKMKAGSEEEPKQNSPHAGKKTTIDVDTGRLISTVCKKLPCATAFGEQSLAGVLLCDVLQFLDGNDVLPLLRDVHRWLVPLGRVVITSVSPAGMAARLRFHGSALVSGRTVAETWAFVEQAGDADLCAGTERPWRCSPVYNNSNGNVGAEDGLCADVGPLGSVFCTQELVALVRTAGFDVEIAEYVTPNKHPLRFSERDDGVVVVARKS